MPALMPLVVAALLAAQQKAPVPDTVEIPAGKIKAGDPPREIELRPFRMGARELTWTQFNAYFESKDMAEGVDAVTRPLNVEAFMVCSACRIRQASRMRVTAGDGSCSVSIQ